MGGAGTRGMLGRGRAEWGVFGRWTRVSAVALLAAGIVAISGLRGQPPGAVTPDGRTAAEQERSDWWAPGSGEALPALAVYKNASGHVGVLNTEGPVQTKGHPFFEPIGSNGRACVSCHQPADGMGLSLRSINERWRDSGGTDPIFAMNDGANCPTLAPGKASSHSLLLKRGLFRIALPWPPRNAQGKPVAPEFDIEVVRDPGGCNTDPIYGLNGENPTISVYRRPRVVANMSYVTHDGFGVGPFVGKTGEPALRDPDTGKPLNMNMMADARTVTLKAQMADAARDHLMIVGRLTPDQAARIEAFERQVYVAQVDMGAGGSLIEPDGPPGMGPFNLRDGAKGVLGNNTTRWVIPVGDAWTSAKVGETAQQRAMRDSILRGQKIFHFRTFWIRDSMHLNTVGLGNPTKRTCSTCHGMHMTGMDTVNGWMDIGTTNLPWAKEAPRNPWQTEDELMPLFRITCSRSAQPHPYLGRVIYTQDPGRALISGRCNDVGTIVMQQFRGLSARAPYFSNGSAQTIRELVDFYDRRYNVQLSEQEKADLGNFLAAL